MEIIDVLDIIVKFVRKFSILAIAVFLRNTLTSGNCLGFRATSAEDREDFEKKLILVDFRKHSAAFTLGKFIFILQKDANANGGFGAMK